MSAQRPPLVLAILDGWGIAPAGPGNAIARAHTPHWDRICAAATTTELAASGEAVGLPSGVMGNSEVGHITIGSGRVVPQGVVVINAAIAEGELPQNATLQACSAHVQRSGGRLHLLGLLSDGCVHSSIEHLEALTTVLAQSQTPFVIDAITDGRDVPPRSAAPYLERIERHCAALGIVDAIATISGRFFAMDRDRRWERTEAAYRALIGEATHHAATTHEALEAAYARQETDEFIVPTSIGAPRPLTADDAVLFFNFRPDRARQITLAFIDPRFDAFALEPSLRAAQADTTSGLLFASMMRYDESFTNPILFGPRPQYDTFGDVVSQAGLRQLRIAETEKYAHVTYFFNGGREEVLPLEERRLIPSDRSVATYDLAPAMQAEAITDAALASIAGRTHDVVVINYANPDMVGHTGVLPATIASIEILDEQLGRLADAVLAADGILAVTADHGNAEAKLDAAGQPLTSHTLNPVPFVLLAKERLGMLASEGRLGDIAPSLLPLLGLSVPAAMTGRNLLASATALTSP